MKVAAVKKPVCPQHHKTMEFSKALSMWTCTEPKCIVRANKKDEQDAPVTPQQNRQLSLFPAAEEIIEPVGLVLYLDFDPDTESERYVVGVYHPEKQTMFIDVSDNVEVSIDNQTNSVTLCLEFHNVKRG
jgi:hypothetical protein